MPAKDLKIWRKCAAHNEADLRREWLAEAGRSCSKLILSWFVCLKKFHFIIRRFDRNVACEISARLLLWLWGERLDLYFWSRSVLHKNELIQDLLVGAMAKLCWFLNCLCQNRDLWGHSVHDLWNLDLKLKFVPNLKEIMFAWMGWIWSHSFCKVWRNSLKAFLRYCHTRKYCFDVPGCDGVNEGVHIKHDNRDSEAVGVSFHRAGVEVVPLDSHTLLFILREILATKAKGHRGQEALRRQEQTILTTTIHMDRKFTCI